MTHNSSEYLHTLIEALSLSFADTLWYNADPNKVKVPVSGLLCKEYAAKRRALINAHRSVFLLFASFPFFFSFSLFRFSSNTFNLNTSSGIFFARNGFSILF